MKSVLVCYESKYGYSQKYAQWIAKELGGRALPEGGPSGGWRRALCREGGGRFLCQAA